MMNIEKYEEAKRLREAGLTLREVGEKLGISQSRVSQMLKYFSFSKEEKQIHVELPAGEKIIDQLTIGTSSSLQKLGIVTNEQIISSFQSGRLAKIGKKKLAEISLFVAAASNAK